MNNPLLSQLRALSSKLKWWGGQDAATALVQSREMLRKIICVCWDNYAMSAAINGSDGAGVVDWRKRLQERRPSNIENL